MFWCTRTKLFQLTKTHWEARNLLCSPFHYHQEKEQEIKLIITAWNLFVQKHMKTVDLQPTFVDFLDFRKSVSYYTLDQSIFWFRSSYFLKNLKLKKKRNEGRKKNIFPSSFFFFLFFLLSSNSNFFKLFIQILKNTPGNYLLKLQIIQACLC